MISYGWTWIEGEDDEEGNEWIQISPLTEEGFCQEEMATIMCRNASRVRTEHPEWIINKEKDAQDIVDALNAVPAQTDEATTMSNNGRTEAIKIMVEVRDWFRWTWQDEGEG